MNWDRKCRLCLTDNPMRPVHALKTPELCSLLKDLCSIEIDINDNMDLVCTNCVQVIFSLKFFKSNQKVIEECRGFQKDVLAIKEENDSSDCLIVDHTQDVGTNKNDQEENIKGTKNKKTPTKSTSSANDLGSTAKRKSTNDEYSIKKNLLDVSDRSPYSSILLASDEDTWENEISSKTQIDTTTNSTNAYSQKLKKCKIVLTRIKTIESKNEIKKISRPLNIRKEDNHNLRNTTTNDNLQLKSRPSKAYPIVTMENNADSSSAMVFSKPKQYTENSIESVSTSSATVTQNKSLVTKSHSQTMANKTLETTTNTATECTYTEQQVDQQKPAASLHLISHNDKNGMELLKMPTSLTCTVIPKPTSNIPKTLTNIKTSDISIKKLEVPNVNIKEQLTSTCIDKKPDTKLKAIENEIHNLASVNIHNMIPLNSKSTSKDLDISSRSLHIDKNVLSKSDCNMKVLTVSELNNGLKAVGEVNPNDINSTARLNLRIIRHGSNFGIKVQRYGCAVKHCDLNAQQLLTLQQSLEVLLKGKKLQDLFSMYLPDEETKALLQDLKIEHCCKSVLKMD